MTLHVLDPQLLQQLPEQIRVDLFEEGASGTTQPTTTGSLSRQETLQRQEGLNNDTYSLTFTADRMGKFIAKLPPIAGGVEEMNLEIPVTVPRLELNQPQLDRAALSKLVAVMGGEIVDPKMAAEKLPQIPSAARVIPIDTSRPLWDAPLAMILFVLLITAEWVLRKLYGML